MPNWGGNFPPCVYVVRLVLVEVRRVREWFEILHCTEQLTVWVTMVKHSVEDVCLCYFTAGCLITLVGESDWLLFSFAAVCFAVKAMRVGADERVAS